MSFEHLYDAFSEYWWNGKDYDANKLVIDEIGQNMLNAKSEQGYFDACLDILEWGLEAREAHCTQ